MSLEAVISTQVIDTTSVGRSVMTAANSAAARSAIGAGTSSFDGAYSSLSGIPSTFTPSSHVHGNITNAGAIGSTANLPLITTTSGVVTVGAFGTTANTFCQGDDARLSDARTPTAHNQAWSTITSTPTTLAGYGITDAITSAAVAAGYLPLSGGTTTGNVTINVSASGRVVFRLSNTYVGENSNLQTLILSGGGGTNLLRAYVDASGRIGSSIGSGLVAKFQGVCQTAADVGLHIKQAASHTGNFLTLVNSSDAVIFSVSSTGSINTRVTTQTSAATATPDFTTTDQYQHTAQAADLTINAPTGTPDNGKSWFIRLKDNGTARALTWNAAFRAIGVTLPTTTTINKTLYVGGKYNSADSKYDVLAVGVET